MHRTIGDSLRPRTGIPIRFSPDTLLPQFAGAAFRPEQIETSENLETIGPSFFQFFFEYQKPVLQRFARVERVRVMGVTAH